MRAGGWLSGDDGFLALDKDGNGRIDVVSELFGGQGALGLEELAHYDENGDHIIDASELEPGSKGFGHSTDLTMATSNDFGLRPMAA